MCPLGIPGKERKTEPCGFLSELSCGYEGVFRDSKSDFLDRSRASHRSGGRGILLGTVLFDLPLWGSISQSVFPGTWISGLSMQWGQGSEDGSVPKCVWKTLD